MITNPSAAMSPEGSGGVINLVTRQARRNTRSATVRASLGGEENIQRLDAALTFRVQADRDVIVVEGARGKHVDPSLKAWELGKGKLPTTAKMGIDATIPETIRARRPLGIGKPRTEHNVLREIRGIASSANAWTPARPPC